MHVQVASTDDRCSNCSDAHWDWKLEGGTTNNKIIRKRRSGERKTQGKLWWKNTWWHVQCLPTYILYFMNYWHIYHSLSRLMDAGPWNKHYLDKKKFLKPLTSVFNSCLSSTYLSVCPLLTCLSGFRCSPSCLCLFLGHGAVCSLAFLLFLLSWGFALGVGCSRKYNSWHLLPWNCFTPDPSLHVQRAPWSISYLDLNLEDMDL